MNRQQPLAASSDLNLNALDYFEARGLNVLVFSNWYSSDFSDSKISGVEVIHHGVRTVTNGDVRLDPTPGQWDPIPVFKRREIHRGRSAIEAYSAYPAYDFDFMIRVEPTGGGIRLSVNLDRPLPPVLEGRVGFNLEFLPAAYAEKAYLMDGVSGIFPLYPSGPMRVNANGVVEPQPLATGKTLVFAPEDPARRITVVAQDGELQLYDGRNQAQNGWYVARGLLLGGRTGTVLQWHLTANRIPGWTRPPVIAHSQVGYHPNQKKVAIIEFDKHDNPTATARLLRVTAHGTLEEAYTAPLTAWGDYTRYHYRTFDFTAAGGSGLYVIEVGDQLTRPFRIAADVYTDAWQPTLDVFFPVQMDHMYVREAYRVWHSAAHLDDALQAPVDHEHFDLYAQSSATDTPYAPGEHIPGLNVGGWFDAGDYDIRTQTQYAVVSSMVRSWEDFAIERDVTTVDQAQRYVEIHRPDGKPDLLEQIEHGVLALIAQYRAVGHAIPGIIVPNITQYTHLGDGSTETDNVVTDLSEPIRRDKDGFRNSLADDRWAFTSRTTALTYGSIAALAAASRALSGFNDELAAECLATAEKTWDEEHGHAPYLFSFGNTTGGHLEEEELGAAVELLICKRDTKYAERVEALWPATEQRFERMASLAARALPYMDEGYRAKLRARVQVYRYELEELARQNPFGVPIATGGWAGNGRIISWAITNFLLHKAYPDLIDPDFALKGLNFLYGCHPDSDISFVSGVGSRSKKVAYGSNRADFTYIAGGVVPGILIIKPDFPENKEDWPFLWGENEYVVNVAAEYIYLVHAANELVPRDS